MLAAGPGPLPSGQGLGAAVDDAWLEALKAKLRQPERIRLDSGTG